MKRTEASCSWCSIEKILLGKYGNVCACDLKNCANLFKNGWSKQRQKRQSSMGWKRKRYFIYTYFSPLMSRKRKQRNKRRNRNPRRAADRPGKKTYYFKRVQQQLWFLDEPTKHWLFITIGTHRAMCLCLRVTWQRARTCSMYYINSKELGAEETFTAAVIAWLLELKKQTISTASPLFPMLDVSVSWTSNNYISHRSEDQFTP